MANLITLSRLLLVLVVILLAHFASPPWHLLNVVLLILAFVTDALDGAVARKRGEASRFGAMFDIATDRIVELSLWVLFAQLGLVGLWVPLVFIARGSITDSIRAVELAETGRAPFNSLDSPLSRWIVAGVFMRVFYAVVKAVTFCWLMLSFALSALLPDLPPAILSLMQVVGQALVLLSVALCLLRGAPVLVEFLRREGARSERQLPNISAR
jgi:CDP-diacylglycerol---glycerol-3-phosphate 3-phosphatidyltransferase